MLWRPTYHRRLAQLADAVTTAFSFIATYFLWKLAKVIFPWVPFGREIEISPDIFGKIIIFSLAWVIVLTKLNAYTYQRFTSLQREIRIVAKTSLIGTLLFLAGDFIFRFTYIPRTYVGIFFILNFISLVCEKMILFEIAKRMRKKGKDRKKILVVGVGERAKNFIETVEKNIEWGLDIVGLVAEDTSVTEEEIYGKRVLGSNTEIEKILHQYPVDEVIICASGNELSRLEFEEVFEICEREGVQIRINSDFMGKLTKKVTVDHIYGLSIISYLNTPHNEWTLYLKRLLDILISGILLIVLSPFFLVIGILIKLTSAGPVFYEWDVIGFNKKPFRSWKFRTMVVNADEMKEKLMDLNEMKGPVFKIKNDPRITKIGRFLRKFSLDELPRLWGILKGDMSLVGPRPALYNQDDLIALRTEKGVHKIIPGITGWAQVNGRDDLPIPVKVGYDEYYLKNRSFFFDIKILFLTLFKTVKSEGVQH